MSSGESTDLSAPTRPPPAVSSLAFPAFYTQALARRAKLLHLIDVVDIRGAGEQDPAPVERDGGVARAGQRAEG